MCVLAVQRRPMSVWRVIYLSVIGLPQSLQKKKNAKCNREKANGYDDDSKTGLLHNIEQWQPPQLARICMHCVCV